MDEEKRITDMYLAAALHAYGFTLVRVDKTNYRRQQFYFSGGVPEVYRLDGLVPLRAVKPELDDVEMWYIAGKLMFPPNYPDSIKRIKSAIHSGK